MSEWINRSARGFIMRAQTDKTPNLGERYKEEQISGTATKLPQSIPTINTNTSLHFMLF